MRPDARVAARTDHHVRTADGPRRGRRGAGASQPPTPLDRPPAWAVLFAKAYSAVAANRPELRRTYLPAPWPHLWEADESVASVAVERDYCNEPGVFFGFFHGAEKVPLADLAATLDEWKTKPLEEVRAFRRQIKYTRLPLPVRRFLWWYATAWSGTIKAKNFGTFGVSLTGASGATALNLIGTLTGAFNTGIIRGDGSVDARLSFDHRVLDGMVAARALAEMETYLRAEIVTELKSMTEPPAPRTSVAFRTADVVVR